MEYYDDKTMTCIKVRQMQGNMVKITVKNKLLKYMPDILAVLNRGF